MSILIKGMEMPKRDDEYVIFTVYGDGGVVYGPLNRPHVRYKNRAVPGPPHGRLIDADALADVFRSFIAMYDSCPFSQLSLPDKARRDELQSALAEVINAPTIIEAEEDK